MGDKVKVSILELNSAELLEPTERELEDNIVDVKTPASIGLSPSSTDVRLALQELAASVTGKVFGNSFQQAFTAAVFTTSSATFQTIQTLSLSSLPSANYLVLGSSKILKSLLAGQAETRLLLNGSTVLSLQEVAMDDNLFYYGDFSIAYLSGLSGNNTITLQVRKSSGGGDVSAKGRLLLFWRVS